MKKALTYTIIAGSKACVNDCPICISKMTPDYGIGHDEPGVNWETFRKATRIAINHGAENVLITGKGEPTLFPAQITKYLHELEHERFDRRELQTEGSRLANGGKLYDEFLRVWKDHGLDVVAISVYHHDDQKNREMFKPNSGRWYELSGLIRKLHVYDFRTRLSCVMLNSYIDSVDEAQRLIDFARNNNVFQLTLRRASKPENPLDLKVADFVDTHGIDDDRFKEVCSYLERKGTLCDILPHGALVYEVDKQNVCITTGLTHDAGEKEIRQLIFFPPDVLTTSWENIYGGRIL